MPSRVRLFRPGRIEYHDAWRWQRHAAGAVREGGSEALALLEHLPVYTLGRRVRTEHLLLGRDGLARLGADVVESDRGGDVTFHGPGQLVAYPILDLRARALGAADYVRLLEETMIRVARHFGVEAVRSPGRPGVWVDGAKLGAIGVRVQRGVSMHGLALNVETDLRWFDAIVPCGLTGVRVTSLAELLDRSPGMRAAEETFIAAFEAVFGSRLEAPGDTSIDLEHPELVHEPEVALGR